MTQRLIFTRIRSRSQCVNKNKQTNNKYIAPNRNKIAITDVCLCDCINGKKEVNESTPKINAGKRQVSGEIRGRVGEGGGGGGGGCSEQLVAPRC